MANALHKRDVVRKWRNKLGLSQRELADAVDVQRLHINRMEAGEPVSLIVLAKIAKKVSEPLTEALTDEGLRELENIKSLLD